MFSQLLQWTFDYDLIPSHCQLCLARDSLPLDLPGQPYTHWNSAIPLSILDELFTNYIQFLWQLVATKIVMNYDELLLLTWGVITNCRQYANIYIYISIYIYIYIYIYIILYIIYIILYILYIYYIIYIYILYYIYVILIIRYTNPWTYPQLQGFWMLRGAQVDQGPRGWHLFGHQHHRGLLRQRVARQP